MIAVERTFWMCIHTYLVYVGVYSKLTLYDITDAEDSVWLLILWISVSLNHDNSDAYPYCYVYHFNGHCKVKIRMKLDQLARVSIQKENTTYKEVNQTPLCGIESLTPVRTLLMAIFLTRM